MREDQARHNIAESMNSGAAFAITNEHERIEPTRLAAIVAAAQQSPKRHGDIVVRAVGPMVVNIASRVYLEWCSHLSPSASFDDVVAGGLEGVARAVKKFDIGRGNRFTTMAHPWIRDGSQVAVRTMIGAGKIPRAQLRAGIAADSAMVSSTTLSIEAEADGYLAQAGGPELKIDHLRDLLETLHCVDRQLPDIMTMLGDEISPRIVAMLVGITPERVEELRTQAAVAVRAAGLD